MSMSRVARSFGRAPRGQIVQASGEPEIVRKVSAGPSKVEGQLVEQGARAVEGLVHGGARQE
ncbi:hypothetical protein AB0B45_20870 [Nonomuraea sp. NPDC049152]|uniref:hypothetical protein n=1 Tax=Nonomuraea sp. NPDC049152 TaxID=3154350 RepID=UPI0033F2C5B2